MALSVKSLVEILLVLRSRIARTASFWPAEVDSLGATNAGDEGRFGPRSGGVGEELHEGDHDAEAVDNGFEESRGSGEGGSKLDVEDVVLEAEEIGSRMIGGEAARNARKLLGLESAEEFANFPVGQNAAEFFEVTGDMPANGEQLMRVGHIDAAADGNFLVRDSEVIAAVAARIGTMAMESGSNVLLIGFLVLAKADVAIDAEDGLAGIRFVFGSEIAERGVESVNQLTHGLLDFLFEERFAGKKPFAVVVAGKAAEELESFGRKTGEWRRHGLGSFAGEQAKNKPGTQIRCIRTAKKL